MIKSLDHLVLTVASIEATCHFYQDVLGMEKSEFAGGRVALHFGTQKINLHQAGAEFEPKAQNPTQGSADLCFILTISVTEAMELMHAHGIEIEEGPVPRTGASGPISSIYVRDPDGNLIELSEQQ